MIRVEDHNEPVHAEDDCDEDHGHLGDLQKRVQEERMKAAIQIHHITPRINRIQSFNQGEDELEGEVADVHVGQHYQQVTEPSRENIWDAKLPLSLPTHLLEAVLDNTQTERKLPPRPSMMTPRVTGVTTSSQASVTAPSVMGHP